MAEATVSRRRRSALTTADWSGTLQHELALLLASRNDHAERVLVMLLCLDLTDATNQLLTGTLRCSSPACAGVLRPWGHARFRRLRDGDAYRPRRARRPTCRRTHVLAWAHSYPALRVERWGHVMGAPLA